MNEHPSTFDVDLLRLGAGDAATRTHVADCAQCTAYFDSLTPQERAVPLWRRAFIPASALLASVALVFVVTQQDVVTSKAAPAVAVYVKHGERVNVWDGRAPVAAFDAVRLEVAAEGFEYVAVVAAPHHVLYSGRLAGPRDVLPLSFVIDDEGTEDNLYVIMSRDPVDERALDGIMQSSQRDKRVWTTRLHFEKGPR